MEGLTLLHVLLSKLEKVLRTFVCLRIQTQDAAGMT